MKRVNPIHPSIKEGYQVFRTNDLSIFKESEVNRNYKPNHEVINNILEKGFDKFCPLSVSTDFVLHDGNTRWLGMLAYCDEHGINIEHSPFDVYFIIEDTKDSEIERIKAHNLIARPWVAKDYFDSNCKQGLVPYMALQEAMINNVVETKRKTIKPLLSLGASVIIASHGFCKTADKRFKDGAIPMFDINFYNVMCNYIKGRHLEKAVGKTEFVRALTEWFTYYNPILTDAERRLFNISINNYVGMCETTQHIKNFCSFISLRTNDKRLKPMRQAIMAEYKETGQYPIFK